jgi:hypothetical protein
LHQISTLSSHKKTGTQFNWQRDRITLWGTKRNTSSSFTKANPGSSEDRGLRQNKTPTRPGIRR